MGTGIGEYCKRCGEQLNYDDGFEGGFCHRCSSIVKYERSTTGNRKEVWESGYIQGRKEGIDDMIKWAKERDELVNGLVVKKEEE